MADVLQAANKYHRRLTAEIAKMEEFLSFGEELSRGVEPDDCSLLTNAAEMTLSPEQRTEEPSCLTGNGASANEGGDIPASETSKCVSRFKAKYGASDADRKMSDALERLTSTGS
jgi:hypothetical protein